MEKFLKKHPVFALAELDSYLTAENRFNPGTRSALLTYYKKTGRILGVRRGLYAVRVSGSSQDETPVDPYLLASRMTSNAILAYHTALEFHGKDYSAYNRFYFLADSQTSSLKFRSWEFHSVLHPKALRRKKETRFEVLRSERSGLELQVTSLERTAVDVLDRPDISGTWEEIWRSLEMIEFFDLDKIIEYCLLLENATTAAKVGYFLDQHREALMVEDIYLNKLLNHKPCQPHYLERSRRSDCRLIAKWNLVVPRQIFERSWEGAI
ncbi:MAG: transcriptional regulator [Deltaproteobacteria bacterium]|nr:transcriptional regulator [Deltaproteobacteria bacterium]